MFKHLSIKSRLIFLIGFLAVELVAGAVIGLVNLGLANAELRQMYDQRLLALGRVGQVIQLVTTNQLNVAKAISLEDAGVRTALMNEVDANATLITSLWDAYMASDLGGDERAMAGAFAEARKAFLAQGLRPAQAAIRAGDNAQAVQLLNGPILALYKPMQQQGDKLVALMQADARAEYEASQAAYELVRLVCLAGLAVGLALAAVIGWLLVRAIVGPLEQAVAIAGAVAAGDLTQRIDATSNDETGRLLQALKEMNGALVKIVSRVRNGTDTIATASSQIAAGNLDLSARTEEQASSLEETAASMEELTSTVKQNADNARQANALAASASEVAGKGGAVVEQVVRTMGAINASATRIVDIIAVIDGIAFQTNILALNAAVEAARAGEQGRGFAVVAGEVRNLAQRSAAAAKEIKALIDDSVEKVHHGSELVDQAGATMAEIVQSVGRVTGIMAEITAASQEQTAGIEQINSAITQMDQVTQQNAALVEQASAAAQSLQEEAAALAQTVGAFKLDGAAQPLRSTAVALAAARPARAQAAPLRARAGKPAKSARAARAEAAEASDGWEAF